MKENRHWQNFILYADASAPQHSCLAGLGAIALSTADPGILYTTSKRVELRKSCTLHAELLAIRIGLNLLPPESKVLLRSDSISALWLLHVTDTIPYQNTPQLGRMAGGKQGRLELRKKKQTETFLRILEECKSETTQKHLLIESLWIKGHANNEIHALADRLAAGALREERSTSK